MEIVTFTLSIPQIPPITTIKLSDFAAWNEFKVMIKSFWYPSSKPFKDIIPNQTSLPQSHSPSDQVPKRARSKIKKISGAPNSVPNDEALKEPLSKPPLKRTPHTYNHKKQDEVVLEKSIWVSKKNRPVPVVSPISKATLFANDDNLLLFLVRCGKSEGHYPKNLLFLFH